MAHEFDPSPLAWLERVYETQEDEISCLECQHLVSEYVDLELENVEAGERLPQLAQHLNQCPACWETHEILLELARLETGGELPEVEELAKRVKNNQE
jgi:hypothetical protein